MANNKVFMARCSSRENELVAIKQIDLSQQSNDLREKIRVCSVPLCVAWMSWTVVERSSKHEPCKHLTACCQLPLLVRSRWHSVDSHGLTRRLVTNKTFIIDSSTVLFLTIVLLMKFLFNRFCLRIATMQRNQLYALPHSNLLAQWCSFFLFPFTHAVSFTHDSFFCNSLQRTCQSSLTYLFLQAPFQTLSDGIIQRDSRYESRTRYRFLNLPLRMKPLSHPSCIKRSKASSFCTVWK